MTRYQPGFNPFVGPVHLPSTDAVDSARQSLVAQGKKSISAAKPFERMFDMWSTAIRLALLEDLDPTEHANDDRRKFHDNIGALIGGDLPLMALLAATAVHYEVAYGGKVFEEAIKVLDDPRRQVTIGDLYAHVGMLRLLEVIDAHKSAPGPGITRHFQKLMMKTNQANA